MGRQVLETQEAHSQHVSCNSNDDMSALAQQNASQVGERIIFLSGEVNENIVPLVIAQLINYANQDAAAPIYMMINTPGGSIDEMFSLYDVMKFLPCPIHTIALGKVMSAGVLLLSSGTKGKRLIGKNARIMIHSVSAGTMGNVFEIENYVEETKRLQTLMVETLVSETKMNLKQAEEIMKNGRDHYLTPAEAIKLGIVDKIIGC